MCVKIVEVCTHFKPQQIPFQRLKEQGFAHLQKVQENERLSRVNLRKADMSSFRRSRSSRTRSSPSPGPWSEWEWNETYKQYYRWRKAPATGTEAEKWEYEYSGTESQAAPAVDPAAASALPAIAENVEASQVPGKHPQDQTTLDTVSQPQAPAQGSQYNVSCGQKEGARRNSFNTGQGNFNAEGGWRFGDRHIRPQDSSTSVDLHPAFKVHPSSDFTFGKVFKVLWSEPKGSAGTSITNTVRNYRKAKFNEPAYDSIRRFIVVDDRHEGHCLCLPILTYSGQGTTKKGVHPETHAAIFTGKGPVTKPHEKLTKTSIRMSSNSAREKLDDASRINYAKVYTVEHNVKVFFIGSIAPKYEQRFLSDYKATHPPMPDRPYKGEITDDVFDHAAGPDPDYPAQHTTTAPWQISHTERYNYHPSTTTESAYGIPAASNWSINQQTQASSSYTSQGSLYHLANSPPAGYAVPSNSTPRYENSIPMEPPYPTTLLYSHHPQEGVGAGHAEETQAVGEMVEEAPAVETLPREYDNTLYDVSD